MIFVARANTSGGIVRPICFAAFRLITNSNFVGCSTGMSAGLRPFKAALYCKGRDPFMATLHQRAAKDGKSVWAILVDKILSTNTATR